MSYTPGPWKIVLYGDYWMLTDMHGRILAWIERDASANARLIAAAPDLLAALKKLLAALKKLCAEVQENNCTDIVLDEYCAAIDAAKEES